jgi:hypothetical protein
VLGLEAFTLCFKAGNLFLRVFSVNPSTRVYDHGCGRVRAIVRTSGGSCISNLSPMLYTCFKIQILLLALGYLLLQDLLITLTLRPQLVDFLLQLLDLNLVHVRS